MTPVLVLNDVEVKYMDVILVLRGVSLQVETGRVTTLLGNNGAGKSTTLKAISGLLRIEQGRVTRGTIEFEGKRIENGDPEKIARQGIVQVLEGRRVLGHLTVEENLRVGAYTAASGGTLSKDLDRIYGYFPALKQLRGQTSGYLSGGEQQMLVMGRALMAHPRLMLIDEASLGLAPLIVEEIFRVLKLINEEEKVSVLLVEQNTQAALKLAHYGYVMENGRIVLDGSADKLVENTNVKDFYLGVGLAGQAAGCAEMRQHKKKDRWFSLET